VNIVKGEKLRGHGKAAIRHPSALVYAALTGTRE
jgi:hypothetical protein